DFHPLPIAVREVPHRPGPAPDEADRGETPVDDRAGAGGPMAGPRGEPEVLGHRQAIVDPRHLELDPDPGSRDLVGQEPRDVETLEVDRPRGRFELAG